MSEPSNIARIVDQPDPKAYIAQADQVLDQLRNQLIKVESLHKADRARRLVDFNNALHRLDADHERAVAELTDMIERLKVFRG